MSIESVIPSNHLILCRLLLPSVFASIRVFSNESALCIRWPKNWNSYFSINPSKKYSGLISLKIDWFNLLAVQGTLFSTCHFWFYYCSVVIDFEIRKCDASKCVYLTQDCFDFFRVFCGSIGILGFFFFSYFHKECHWDFAGELFESVNPLGLLQLRE